MTGEFSMPTQFDFDEFNKSIAMQTIIRATLPIIVSVNDGERHFERSAVFFRIGNEHFLFTAIHDLQKFDREDVRVFTQLSDGRHESVEITGSKIIGLAPPADIAIVKITFEQGRRLIAGQNALTLRDLDFSTDEDARTPFVMSGYPSSLSERSWSGQFSHTTGHLFSLNTNGYEGTTEHPEQYDRSCHLLVEWHKEIVIQAISGESNVVEGAATDAPKPFGISGGGVWICGFNPCYLDGQSTEKYRCKLSAIEHAVSRRLGYAKSTRIGIVIQLLWQKFPELRADIEKAHPNVFSLTLRFPDRFASD